MTRALASPWWALPLVVGLACSLPGVAYRVAPEVSGVVVQDGEPVATGRLRQQVRSHANATLGRRAEQTLGADGRFRFEPVHLEVAGQEHRRDYFLILYWLEEGRNRTLWRADYPRERLGGPIELACDLDRAAIDGPPCILAGAVFDQPWLLDAARADFQALCARCHGADARGTDGAPDLTRIAARQDGFSRDEIARFVDGRREVAAHGGREMPVWGERLQDPHLPPIAANQERVRNRIDFLVLYLESLQEP